jgi:hypothetical protein
MDLRRAIPVFASGTLLLIAAGCGSGGGTTSSFYTVPNTVPKPADTINRVPSPQPRADALTAHLAQYRAEALGASAGLFQTRHDDVMYNAAVRHAIYLNSINSSAVGAYGGGPETQTITATTAYSTLLTEPTAGGTPWPMCYTSTDLVARIQAVYGGTTLLQSIGADRYSVDEIYMFDGDIWRTGGAISDFRSYPVSVADPVESAWYQRRGRQHLMRASLVYFGFGAKSDPVPNGVVATPPYPILNNRFVGVLSMVHSRPMAGALGWWPNNNNQNVNPFGLDTDMGGTEQYAGPPLHITLPVAEPIMATNGGLALDLTRVDQYDGSAIAPAYPYNQLAWRRFRAFTNVQNLQVLSSFDTIGGFQMTGNPVPVIANSPMENATFVSYVAINSIPLNNATYTIQFAASADLSLANVGDTLRITVQNKSNPAPNAASIGYYDYTIVAVDVNAKTVTVNIPLTIVPPNGHAARPFESLPTTEPPIRYGAIDNVTLSVYNPGASLKYIAEVDKVMNLTNGEMVVVPVAPLEKNAWYRFRFQLRTPSYDSGLKTVFFKTNGRSY